MALTDTTIPPITGIDDPAQARVLLYQAGRTVHAPLDSVGLLTDSEGAATYLTQANAATTYLPLSGGTISGNLTVTGTITPSTRWETIAITDVTSPVASVNFTNLGAFRSLRLNASIYVTTNATQVLLRTSTNNGSSYDAGATDYFWQWHVAADVTGGTARSDTSAFPTLAAIAQHNAYPMSFNMLCENFNKALLGSFHAP